MIDVELLNDKTAGQRLADDDKLGFDDKHTCRGASLIKLKKDRDTSRH